jgi:putative endonuclease
MTNQVNTVLYTGVTSSLQSRVYQHKEKLVAGFTSRYNINKLVYYEECADALSAISREKQIKSWSRKDKIDLVKSMNINWDDLYDSL